MEIHPDQSRLVQLLSDFERWARTADRSEIGWESDYPRWDELMEEAMAAMRRGVSSAEERDALGRCWEISEEDETLADYCRDHLVETRETAIALTRDTRAAVRWQAYDVLGQMADTADILVHGLQDEDEYVRRRAFLAYSRNPGRTADAA